MTPRDSGWYDCQVNTEPKLSSKVHLLVLRPSEASEAASSSSSGWMRELASAASAPDGGGGGTEVVHLRRPMMHDSPATARPLRDKEGRGPGRNRKVLLAQMASTTGEFGVNQSFDNPIT